LFKLFQDAVHIISGGLDSQLKLYDLNNNTETVLGNHDNAIKCVEYSSKINGVVTGSWDKVR
jgi:cell cycle arrest protein BUB3